MQRASGVPDALFGRKIHQSLGRFASRGREVASVIGVPSLRAKRSNPDSVITQSFRGDAKHRATNAISTSPGIASGLLALDGFGKMTGSTRSSGGLDDRRKRLLFRCWHRGTREMDLILGRFADAEIATLKDDELAQLEHLIEVPDPDLYAAVSGNRALAGEYASSLFDRIKSFRSADRDA